MLLTHEGQRGLCNSVDQLDMRAPCCTLRSALFTLLGLAFVRLTDTAPLVSMMFRNLSRFKAP